MPQGWPKLEIVSSKAGEEFTFNGQFLPLTQPQKLMLATAMQLHRQHGAIAFNNLARGTAPDRTDRDAAQIFQNAKRQLNEALRVRFGLPGHFGFIHMGQKGAYTPAPNVTFIIK